MSNRSITSFSALAVTAMIMVGLAAPARAQFVNGVPPVLVASSIRADGSPYARGSVYELMNGSRIVVTDKTSLLVGTRIRQVADEKGNEVIGKWEIFTGKSKQAGLSVGFYPLVAFTTGGPRLGANNTFIAGTDRVLGSIISLDSTKVYENSGRQLTVGGWYFTNGTTGARTDLYQIHVRNFDSSGKGWQLAYLDSTLQRATSFTAMAMFRLASGSIEPNVRTPWSLVGGLGFINNLTDDVNPETSQLRSRSTIGNVFVLEGSCKLNDALTLQATYWFVRDRNVDLGRGGIGLSWRF